MDDTLELFNHFLQRNVVFALDNKIIKEGNLFLYKQNDYYLFFYLKNNNQEQKKFEIPYPFSIKREKNYIILDYSLSAISKADSELYYRLVSLNQKSSCRYYNNKILVFEKNTLDLSLLP
jgi:hypothetical protein